MPDDNAAEPKIIIDEDWKSKVQAEKEAMARQPAPESGEAQATATRKEARAPLPPATLTILITMLAAQASIALGVVAHPTTGKIEPELDEARHLIDLIQVIEDKTQGNRTSTESALLARVLDELRMGYLAVSQNPPS